MKKSFMLPLALSVTVGFSGPGSVSSVSTISSDAEYEYNYNQVYAVIRGMSSKSYDMRNFEHDVDELRYSKIPMGDIQCTISAISGDNWRNKEASRRLRLLSERLCQSF